MTCQEYLVIRTAPEWLNIKLCAVAAINPNLSHYLMWESKYQYTYSYIGAQGHAVVTGKTAFSTDLLHPEQTLR